MQTKSFTILVPLLTAWTTIANPVPDDPAPTTAPTSTPSPHHYKRHKPHHSHSSTIPPPPPPAPTPTPSLSSNQKIATATILKTHAQWEETKQPASGARGGDDIYTFQTSMWITFPHTTSLILKGDPPFVTTYPSGSWTRPLRTRTYPAYVETVLPGEVYVDE